jgi:two-component system, OmpR family, sensor kinase
VFERFHTREHASRGLGIGLYLTQAIVVAHGGTIRMTPTEGGGTTVTVRLPHQADTE